jgi:hypothetical protein
MRDVIQEKIKSLFNPTEQDDLIPYSGSGIGIKMGE